MSDPQVFRLEEVEEAMHDSMGFCIACGAMSEDMVEPDARNYHCYECDENEVFGAEELFVMGLVE